MVKRPNILLVLTDQQRMDSLGAYGASLSDTPHVDALAERGVVFRQAYTPCTVCSPARASLFTGRYPHEHGVTRNGAHLDLSLPTIAQPLMDAGYRLGYTGKWHVDDVYGPTHFGFEANDWLGYSHPAGGVYMRSFARSCKYPVNHYLEYLKERGIAQPELEDAVYYPAMDSFEIYARQTGPVEASFEHYVAEEAIGLAERFAQRAEEDERPFFIWANFWGPHDPYILPEPFYSRFNGEDVQLSDSMQEEWHHKPWVQRMMSSNYWGVEDMDESIWREAVAKYAGYCALLDWETGRMINRLDELGVLDNTIVVYTSDHGSMVGHHKLTDKGPYPYDDIQRIPLIVAGPGVSGGQECNDFAYLHDLAPTFLQIAAAEPIHCTAAQSLIPALVGDAMPQERSDVYMTRHHHPYAYEQRWLRTRRFKYAFNAFDVDELYDLENDPEEMVNRIDDPSFRAVRDQLVQTMWERIVDTRDPIADCFGAWARRKRPSAEERAQLRGR